MLVWERFRGSSLTRKRPPPRTRRWGFAVVPGRGVLSYERGAPVELDVDVGGRMLFGRG